MNKEPGAPRGSRSEKTRERGLWACRVLSLFKSVAGASWVSWNPYSDTLVCCVLYLRGEVRLLLCLPSPGNSPID